MSNSKNTPYLKITDSEATGLLQSSDPKDQIRAFNHLSNHGKDTEWIANELLKNVRNINPLLVSNAIQCLHTLVKVRGVIKLPNMFNIAIERVTHPDREIRLSSEKLLEEIIYHSAGEEEFELESLKTKLFQGELLERLVAIYQLGYLDEPKDEINTLWLKLLMDQEPFIRARCLVEARTFLLQSDDSLDKPLLDKIQDAIKNDPSAYVKRKGNELREWAEVSIHA